MSKLNKKKLKIHDEIVGLEDFLRVSLGKKDSATAEVNVPKILEKIKQLKAQLAA